MSDNEERVEAALEAWKARNASNHNHTSNPEIYFEEGYAAGVAEGIRQAQEAADADQIIDAFNVIG
ncbi:flagellar biosynthesis/type III secretory pathway protein FliH [Agromyces sp. 3263]|uniref:hypothetical protein n=1 Tax=Agromyces sp. 3263 TaxID=2817750 RepID=UPI0028668B9E|nr:hypothetical protein [Agromyces sp. 3263]MDR6907450.1 flagellar biosynthesis/type III secretory pathway protein FliH [Agromyces sp. 3263]